MNTLQFVENIKNDTYRFPDEWIREVDWNKAKSHHPIETIQGWILQKFSSEVSKSLFYNIVSPENETKNIMIQYHRSLKNPSILKIKRTVHDGTLLFTMNAFQEMMENILEGSCYSTQVCPEDYITNFWKYDVHYFLGDLLWFSKSVKHVDEKHGKMFPGQMDCFALAVEIKYILR